LTSRDADLGTLWPKKILEIGHRNGYGTDVH
jgi:hypothetical protein